MSERRKGRYENDNFGSLPTQEIIDTSEALGDEYRGGATVEHDATTRNLRPGTVEGYKTWIERMKGETEKRLKDVQSQLLAAEAFVALPDEEQRKTPLTDRPLRVTYARELVRQLDSAIQVFQQELDSAERGLLAEAARRISKE